MTTRNYLDDGGPGYRTEVETADREFLWSVEHLLWLPGGGTINAAKSRDPLNTGNVGMLRPGLLMGLITADSYYAPAVLGVNAVLHDTSVVTTTMTLAAAVVTEIARRVGASGNFKITGPPTAAGTVATEVVEYSAIASATTLTITATTADFAAGSLIRPNDGSETIKGLLGKHTQVTDWQGNEVNARMPKLAIAGLVRSAQIINWSADTSVQAFIRSALNDPSSGPGPFRFDTNF